MGMPFIRRMYEHSLGGCKWVFLCLLIQSFMLHFDQTSRGCFKPINLLSPYTRLVSNNNQHVLPLAWYVKPWSTMIWSHSCYSLLLYSPTILVGYTNLYVSINISLSNSNSWSQLVCEGSRMDCIVAVLI